jgi:ketosteroid isomerase-like protein
VSDWAQAWSSKDVARYLEHYGPKFRPPKDESRASWEAQRRARIVKDESINVQVEAPAVTVKGGAATVRFTQIYVSGKLNSKERKTLVLEKIDGQWKIVQERLGG